MSTGSGPPSRTSRTSTTAREASPSVCASRPPNASTTGNSRSSRQAERHLFACIAARSVVASRPHACANATPMCRPQMVLPTTPRRTRPRGRRQISTVVLGDWIEDFHELHQPLYTFGRRNGDTTRIATGPCIHERTKDGLAAGIRRVGGGHRVSTLRSIPNTTFPMTLDGHDAPHYRLERRPSATASRNNSSACRRSQARSGATRTLWRRRTRRRSQPSRFLCHRPPSRAC